MMSALRTSAKKFLLIIVPLVILSFIIGFVIMSTNPFGHGKNPEVLATIGKDYIGYTELSRVWQNVLYDYQEKGITMTEEREKEVKKEILDELIDRKLVLKFAAQNGIKVTDQEVASAIQRERMFANEQGKFDINRYQAILANQGINPKAYEESRREEMTVAKVQNALMSSVKLSAPEIEDYARLRSRTLTAEYVYFNYNNFLSELNINEDKLKDYFALNKNKYAKPERVKASHILITEDAAGLTLAALSSGEALARDILAKVRGGADFASLAKQYSKDPGSGSKGGDLGWFERGQMVREFENAAFALPKGGISDIVKTQYGYHIIKVTDKDNGYDPVYSEMRSKVLAEVREAEGMKLAENKANMMLDIYKKEKNFSKAAAAMKATVSVTPRIKENDKTTLESETMVDTLFNMTEGAQPKIAKGKNGWYVFTVKSASPSGREISEKEKSKLSEKLRNLKFRSVYEDFTKSLRAKEKIQIFAENL